MFSFYDAILPRRCLYCKVIIPSNVFCSLCDAMLKRIESFDTEVLAAYTYAGILRDLLITAKFHSDESITHSLTRHLIADLRIHRFNNLLRELPFSAVTYVPSHWRRRLLRGHELPGIIANGLARTLGIPFRHLINCVRLDSPLAAAQNVPERRERIIGRFRSRHAPFPEGAWILLVDDVITTGSTLRSCANELQLLGYNVKCFAFAKRLLSISKQA